MDFCLISITQVDIWDAVLVEKEPWVKKRPVIEIMTSLRWTQDKNSDDEEQIRNIERTNKISRGILIFDFENTELCSYLCNIWALLDFTNSSSGYQNMRTSTIMLYNKSTQTYNTKIVLFFIVYVKITVKWLLSVCVILEVLFNGWTGCYLSFLKLPRVS